MLILDVVDDRIMFVEVLYRPDVEERLQQTPDPAAHLLATCADRKRNHPPADHREVPGMLGQPRHQRHDQAIGPPRRG